MPSQQAALDRVAALTVTVKAGARADAGLARHESERLGLRRGLRM